MRDDLKIGQIIDSLWNWVTNYKGHPVVKDTSKLSRTKFDFYLDSTAANPLSFTVFEMNNKGELMVDDVTRLVESEAAFFLFVNTEAGWIVAVKNTHENVKKLVKGEKVGRLRVQVVT